MPRPLAVALTGGIGAGKSEALKAFARHGAATASSDEKLEIAKARGADHLVRYDQEPFRDAVKRITDGRGADVVFDPVESLGRLAVLVPRPRINLILYHGVLGPRAAWRS